MINELVVVSPPKERRVMELNERQDVIINDTIKPFLEWCYQEAFNLSTKTQRQKLREKAAVGVGVTLGAFSVASIYPLGGDFGNVVSDHLDITAPTSRCLIFHFFGTTAIIPMLALACVEAKDLFQKIASSNAEKGIIKYNRKNLRNGLITFAYVLAAFSALSPMYATIEAFVNAPIWLKYMTIPSSFFGPLIFKSASEIRLVDRILSKYAPPEELRIKNYREELRNDLSSTIKFIRQLSDENLDALFIEIFNKNRELEDASEKQDQALRRINYFFSHRQQASNVLDENRPNNLIHTSSCGKKFIEGVGACVGAASAYVYYTLAESATLYLCDYLNIQDEETRTVLKAICASMAIVPWGSLGAESTQTVFGKIYDLMSSCNSSGVPKTSFSKKIIAATATFEGVCASTAPVYLAIQALSSTPWYQQLLIIPAFIGPASIRTMAIARLMNEGVDWLSSLSAETTAMRRENLIKTIEKIAGIFDKLPDGQIAQLYADLIGSRPELFNRRVIRGQLNADREDVAEARPLLANQQ